MKTTHLSSLLFISFLIVVHPVNAQKDIQTAGIRHEVSAAVGIGTIQEFASVLANAFTTGLMGQKIVDDKATGAFTLSYQYFPGQRFSFGGTVTWEGMSTTYTNPYQKLEWDVIALMVHCKYYYIVRSGFNVYSHVAAGYAGFYSQSASKHHSNSTFAFQVSPVGLRFGKKVGVFAELGFGFEGLIKAGVACRF